MWGRGLLSICINEVTDKATPDSLGLLIGDFLHNLRSGLDNLAYALMLAGPGPTTERDKSDSEFPIFGDVDAQGRSGQGNAMFARASRKYHGWRPGAKAAVEALQPYQQGRAFASDPLWWLHELDRIDKHRFLHTTVAYSIGADWRPSETVNLRAFGTGFIAAYGGPVERGAPVIQIAGVHLADPNTDVHVEVNPAFDVVFSQPTPAVGERSVLQTTTAIYEHVINNVVPALSQFL